jgi:hypothetical protein
MPSDRPSRDASFPHAPAAWQTASSTSVITTLRAAVARVGSTPRMPTLPKTPTRAAAAADSSA